MALLSYLFSCTLIKHAQANTMKAQEMERRFLSLSLALSLIFLPLSDTHTYTSLSLSMSCSHSHTQLNYLCLFIHCNVSLLLKQTPRNTKTHCYSSQVKLKRFTVLCYSQNCRNGAACNHKLLQQWQTGCKALPRIQALALVKFTQTCRLHVTYSRLLLTPLYRIFLFWVKCFAEEHFTRVDYPPQVPHLPHFILSVGISSVVCPVIKSPLRKRPSHKQQSKPIRSRFAWTRVHSSSCDDPLGYQYTHRDSSERPSSKVPLQITFVYCRVTSVYCQAVPLMATPPLRHTRPE